MNKLDQIKALGDAKRVSRTAVVKPRGLRIKPKPQSVEPSGDGIALTSIAHPPELIEKMADAIRSGKLKSSPTCPVCKARQQARAAAQKKWRAKAAKGEEM